MRIAIFGRSSTGKTTVATELQRILGGEVRHCGEVLKEEAKRHGRKLGELEKEDHTKLDEATRKWMLEGRGILIAEGLLLDAVLGGVSGVTFVELSCPVEVRAERVKGRQSVENGIEEIRRRDKEEEVLRRWLFPGWAGLSVSPIRVDTSEMGAAAVAEKVTGLLRSSHYDKA